jgi:hypothetical protein
MTSVPSSATSFVKEKDEAFSLQIEAGTRLYGLRREGTNLSAARASLRKKTRRRFIQESL